VTQGYNSTEFQKPEIAKRIGHAMKHICFFGDGLIQGIGDPLHVAWPERLATLENGLEASDRSVFKIQDQLTGQGLRVYSLGIPWDTSADIRLRWRDEAMSRLLTHPHTGVVFSFGLSDMAATESGGMQQSLWDSAAHAEAMLRDASREWPVLWIGPPPIVRKPPPLEADGEVYSFSAARLQALNDAYADVAERCAVPYLNLTEILQHSPRWYEALDDGNGIFPSAFGHQVIAREVSRWDPWRQWMTHNPSDSNGAGQSRKPLPPQTLLTPKMVAMGY
jgi:lysophospholipase L1-like esterase